MGRRTGSTLMTFSTTWAWSALGNGMSRALSRPRGAREEHQSARCTGQASKDARSTHDCMLTLCARLIGLLVATWRVASGCERARVGQRVASLTSRSRAHLHILTRPSHSDLSAPCRPKGNRWETSTPTASQVSPSRSRFLLVRTPSFGLLPDSDIHSPHALTTPCPSQQSRNQLQNQTKVSLCSASCKPTSLPRAKLPRLRLLDLPLLFPRNHAPIKLAPTDRAHRQFSPHPADSLRRAMDDPHQYGGCSRGTRSPPCQ